MKGDHTVRKLIHTELLSGHRKSVQCLIKDIKEGVRAEGISFLDMKNRLLARYQCISAVKEGVML